MPQELQKIDAPAITPEDELAASFNRAIFDGPPPPNIVQDFISFVGTKGTPHLWRYHLHTKPDKHAQFRILLRFSIPEKFRKGVGRAPCPICSPNSPKYFDGMLVWFKEEKVLRAIGDDCGRSHFGRGIFDEAYKEFEKRRSDEAASNFLINNLPYVSDAMQKIEGLKGQAGSIDLVRQQTKRALVNNISKAIERAGNESRLKFYEQRRVPVFDRDGSQKVDKDGELITRPENFEVSSLPFNGIRLNKNPNVLSLLNNAYTMLEKLKSANETEAYLLWSNLVDEDRLEEAASNLRSAIRSYEEASQLFLETQLFLKEENIKNLQKWGADNLSPVRFRVRYYTNEVGFCGWRQGKFISVKIPSDTFIKMPALSFIEHGSTV